jgi:hypothetical protein
MPTILRRIDARVRRWLLAGAALLASLAPAALMPEGYAGEILQAIASINVEHIADIAAATNALTLMP